MDPFSIAPMIVAVTFIVVTGGVILLRPVARRLGDLIDVMIADKRRVSQPDALTPSDVERLRNVIESVDQRLRLLEERQDFTDALLGAQNRAARPGESEPRSIRPPQSGTS
ncbi:MAG: hypothetical protein L0271_08105 [Gemmatimonadetes bacterium]|nr:hypothetical protein [Gemmatimonadota bacterium]